MIQLAGVIAGGKKPPRTVIYGPPGIGKSTFGKDSEKPIFVTTEDGVDNVPVDQFPKATGWTEFLENVKQIAETKHDYKTIVIDTLNGAVELASTHICNTMFGGRLVAQPGKGGDGFVSWGNGIKATGEELKKLLVLLDKCRDKNIMVLFLAHTGVIKVESPLDGGYEKFAPEMDKKLWARISGWVDVIGRADFQYVVDKPTTGRSRAIGTSERKLIFSGSAAEDAKTRAGYELPDQIPLSYADFREALGQSGETLKEVVSLWWVLDAAEQKKAMAWLGVEKLELADTTKLRQLLGKLRSKQASKIETTNEQEKTNA